MRVDLLGIAAGSLLVLLGGCESCSRRIDCSLRHDFASCQRGPDCQALGGDNRCVRGSGAGGCDEACTLAGSTCALPSGNRQPCAACIITIGDCVARNHCNGTFCF